MENNKYSANDDNKISNTKIELRKEALNDIRELHDRITSERHSAEDLERITQELTEIAEMIRDKDSMMKVRERLESRKGKAPQSELITQIRKQIIGTIRLKKDVIVGQYDSEELEVVGQEVDEMIAMIQDKDLIMELFQQQKQVTTAVVNDNIRKYFNLDGHGEKEYINGKIK